MKKQNLAGNSGRSTRINSVSVLVYVNTVSATTIDDCARFWYYFWGVIDVWWCSIYLVATRPISTNLWIRGIVTIINVVQAVVIDPQIVVNHAAVVNAELACNDNGKEVKLEQVLDGGNLFFSCSMYIS